MKKFVCSVCSYVHEGDSAPEVCPVCGVPAEKVIERSEKKSGGRERLVGVGESGLEGSMAVLSA